MKVLQRTTTDWVQEESLIPQIKINKILNIGVIGYGYWGPKLVRNFQELPTARVTMVADLDDARLAAARQAGPLIEVTRSYADLLASDVDAVVVATPVSTHFPIAK